MKSPELCKAFALSGRQVCIPITQGDALGYELLPFQGVLGNFNHTGRIISIRI